MLRRTSAFGMDDEPQSSASGSMQRIRSISSERCFSCYRGESQTRSQSRKGLNGVPQFGCSARPPNRTMYLAFRASAPFRRERWARVGDKQSIQRFARLLFLPVAAFGFAALLLAATTGTSVVRSLVNDSRSHSAPWAMPASWLARYCVSACV